MTKYGQIFANGVWTQNPGVIQFLGICPLLAVSNSLVNGLALGIATLLVLVTSNTIVSLVRPYVADAVRLPVFVLIIASLVTIVELWTQAHFFNLWLDLGIFIPLIVTNCVILARAEAFASRQPIAAAIVDGIAHGLGFLLVLVVLGGLREVVGKGTLFADAQQLFGPGAERLTLQILPEGSGFLLALLPPGAFLGLALLVAARNVVSNRGKRKSEALTTPGKTQLQS